MLETATGYAIAAAYAAAATAVSIAAGRQSWRQGRQTYALFAYGVAVLAVIAGSAAACELATR